MHAVDLRKFLVTSVIEVVILVFIVGALQSVNIESDSLEILSEHVGFNVLESLRDTLWILPVIWILNIAWKLNHASYAIKIGDESLTLVSKKSEREVFYKDIAAISDNGSYYTVLLHSRRRLTFFPLKDKSHIALFKRIQMIYRVKIVIEDNTIPGP